MTPSRRRRWTWALAGAAAALLAAAALAVVTSQPSCGPYHCWIRADETPLRVYEVRDGSPLAGWDVSRGSSMPTGRVGLSARLGLIEMLLDRVGLRPWDWRDAAIRSIGERDAGGWQEFVCDYGDWPDAATIDPSLVGTWEFAHGDRKGLTGVVLGRDGSVTGWSRAHIWARLGDVLVFGTAGRYVTECMVLDADLLGCRTIDDLAFRRAR